MACVALIFNTSKGVMKLISYLSKYRDERNPAKRFMASWKSHEYLKCCRIFGKSTWSDQLQCCHVMHINHHCATPMYWFLMAPKTNPRELRHLLSLRCINKALLNLEPPEMVNILEGQIRFRTPRCFFFSNWFQDVFKKDSSTPPWLIRVKLSCSEQARTVWSQFSRVPRWKRQKMDQT